MHAANRAFLGAIIGLSLVQGLAEVCQDTLADTLENDDADLPGGFFQRDVVSSSFSRANRRA